MFPPAPMTTTCFPELISEPFRRPAKAGVRRGLLPAERAGRAIAPAGKLAGAVVPDVAAGAADGRALRQNRLTAAWTGHFVVQHRQRLDPRRRFGREEERAHPGELDLILIRQLLEPGQQRQSVDGRLARG